LSVRERAGVDCGRGVGRGPSRRAARRLRGLLERGSLVTTRAGARFDGLSFPAGERAGFVTDVEARSEASSARYYEALYALAPRVLRLGAGPRLVVADVEDAASIESICAANRLHVVQRPSPKVALLERNR
jgi:hypothetical protein